MLWLNRDLDPGVDTINWQRNWIHNKKNVKHSESQKANVWENKSPVASLEEVEQTIYNFDLPCQKCSSTEIPTTDHKMM